MSKQQKIKNIITDEDMYPWEIGHSWREFEQKISLDHDCIEIDNKLDKLLKQIGDAKLSDNIKSVVAAKECTYAYTWYRQGLFEGMKSVLSLKEKKLSVPI